MITSYNILNLMIQEEKTMEILKNPVMAAKAKACHAKGCKKYTCFTIFLVNNKERLISQNILEIY